MISIVKWSGFLSMVKGEICNLLYRKGLILIILSAFAINFFLTTQGINSPNAYGYTLADINLAYIGLFNEKDQILSQQFSDTQIINQQLPDQYITDRHILDRKILYRIEKKFYYSTFTSFFERLLYIELYNRISSAVNYQANLQLRLEEAELRINSPFFALPYTFDYRSLRTLQRTYGRLAEKNIQPIAESSLGIELATVNRISDAVLAFVALTLAIGIVMLPKEEGFYILIKPMKNGQSKLIAAKFVALLLLLFLATLLIYGTNLLVGHTQFGLGTLTRPVQSLYGFYTSRFLINVWQYLLLFGLYKFLWAISVGSLFFCLCIFMRTSTGVFFAAITVIGISILCFQSTEPWVMMTNLIWVSDAHWYFSGYFNLNLLGYPVDAFSVSIAILFLVAIISYILAYFHFVGGENIFGQKIRDRKNHIFSLHKRHTSLLLHEGYKLFIRQQGLLILIGFLAVQIYVNSTQHFHIDHFDRHYAQILAGPLSAESEAFLVQENQRFDEIKSLLNQYTQQLYYGTISADTFHLLTTPLNTQLLAEPAFRRAEHQYAQIKELADIYYNIANVANVEFVELQVYEHVVGQQARQSNRINAAKLAFVIAIGLSGIFAVERSTNMTLLLASMPFEKNAVKCKIFWAGLYAILAALIAYVPRIVNVNMRLGYSQLDASALSLLFLGHSGYSGHSGHVIHGANITINGLLINTALLWILLSFVGAAAATAVSSKAKSRAMSALATCLLLLTLLSVLSAAI